MATGIEGQLADGRAVVLRLAGARIATTAYRTVDSQATVADTPVARPEAVR
jgi:hypothetical protein